MSAGRRPSWRDVTVATNRASRRPPPRDATTAAMSASRRPPRRGQSGAAWEALRACRSEPFIGRNLPRQNYKESFLLIGATISRGPCGVNTGSAWRSVGYSGPAPHCAAMDEGNGRRHFRRGQNQAAATTPRRPQPALKSRVQQAGECAIAPVGDRCDVTFMRFRGRGTRDTRDAWGREPREGRDVRNREHRRPVQAPWTL
jgi:hypothetical protein